MAFLFAGLLPRTETVQQSDSITWPECPLFVRVCVRFVLWPTTVSKLRVPFTRASVHISPAVGAREFVTRAGLLAAPKGYIPPSKPGEWPFSETRMAPNGTRQPALFISLVFEHHFVR